MNDRSDSNVFWRNIAIVLFSIICFLLSISWLGFGFSRIGKEAAESIIIATSNPFIGLFIGLLATAILQSSSTTTSMAVAAVAAGSLSLDQAVPIVIGANVGTTITSTIVSMSYITSTGEFRKAVAGGTIHDFFNILTVIILFPLELKYGILTDLSHYFVQFIHVDASSGLKFDLFGIGKVINSIGDVLIRWVGVLGLIIGSFILLFAAVKIMSGVLSKELIGNTKSRFESVFNLPVRSFGWGLFLTTIIQSSSVTTSLLVPLTATGKIKIENALRFIIGANIGTTLTAILASLFKSEAAVSLAFVHFFFNLIGSFIFLFIPFASRIPIALSQYLGYMSEKYRIVGLMYIIITFFIFPFALIYFSR
ncbi:MAG: Na/Pi symporter [Bacteroidota bacterium]